jgi:hypothetical protein
MIMRLNRKVVAIAYWMGVLLAMVAEAVLRS